MPKYNPMKDKNLVSFFEKPVIMRQLQRQSRLSSSKTVVTEGSRNDSRLRKEKASCENISKEVSR